MVLTVNGLSITAETSINSHLSIRQNYSGNSLSRPAHGSKLHCNRLTNDSFIFYSDSNVEKVTLVPTAPPPPPKCSQFHVNCRDMFGTLEVAPPPTTSGGRRPLYVNENWGLVKIRTNSKRAPGYNEYLVTTDTCLCTRIIDSNAYNEHILTTNSFIFTCFYALLY